MFCAEAAMTLRELSTVYLPYGYAPSGDGLFARDTGAAEQCVYDAATATVYTVGEFVFSRS